MAGTERFCGSTPSVLDEVAYPLLLLRPPLLLRSEVCVQASTISIFFNCLSLSLSYNGFE